MLDCQLTVKRQQLLLLRGRQSRGHGSEAVKIRVFSLVHDLLHMEQGVFQFLALDRLNGRYPMCLQIVGVHVQPERSQLLLGIVCIQRLGDPHGPLNHAGVP